MQAAQRRKAADAGVMSVADIKKRKEAEQLRREMAGKKQRSSSGAAVAKPTGTGAGASTSAGPGATVIPSPTGAAARPIGSGTGRPVHVGSTGQPSSGPSAPAAESGATAQARSEHTNAHKQSATARHKKHKSHASVSGILPPKDPSSAVGEKGVSGRLDSAQHWASQEPYISAEAAAADQLTSPRAKAEAAPSRIGAVRAGPEKKRGIETLQALVKTGKPKKKRKLPCWEAELLLVEDAVQMLKKANANPGQCHPEVLKELNAIVKRVCCTRMWYFAACP